MRYEIYRRQLLDAVLSTPGATVESVRRAVLERAMGMAGTEDGVPPELTSYVDTVARHAYRVTDANVRALQGAGQTDDAIFEVTVAAAVGAAMHRLQRGMAALRGEEPD